MDIVRAIFVTLTTFVVFYVVRWGTALYRSRFLPSRAHERAAWPGLIRTAVGFVTNFFDNRRTGGREEVVSGVKRRNQTQHCVRIMLEFHHLTPFAAGGEPSVENIQLRCRAHNQHEAELFFGEPFIVRERARAWSTRSRTGFQAAWSIEPIDGLTAP